jgi:translation initiation factor IF-1
MPGSGVWRVKGVIIAVLADGVYRARLVNGHELLAFVAGRAKKTAPRLELGETVSLRVSSYDLSKGRILVEKTQI